MSEVRVQLPLGASRLGRDRAGDERELRGDGHDRRSATRTHLLRSTLYSLYPCSVWESLGIRVPWAHEIVSSNLTTLTELRWSSCWYESRRAGINRHGN